VGVYEIVGEAAAVSPETARFLRDHTEAMGLYFERRWAEAARRLEDALGLFPNDAPARARLDECRLLASRPPPPEWNGVTVMG
jgi:hypothetical protein